MCKHHDHHDPESQSSTEPRNLDRRTALKTGALMTAAAATGLSAASAHAADDPYAPPAEPALPPSGMVFNRARAALVVTDPQIDFLSPNGATWGVVGESVSEQGTVENIEKLFITAKSMGMPVFVSPHYYYPHDHKWKFEGTLEKVMHNISMFDRPSPLDLNGFDGSGADWMPRYKKYIDDGETVVTSPHKIYGPEQNDLNLQLRKRGIDKVILAGMSANLCVQAHLYELLEQGYEVAVVRDATAGAKVPEGDGYLAALINFRFVASAVWWTDEAVANIQAAA